MGRMRKERKRMRSQASRKRKGKRITEEARE